MTPLISMRNFFIVTLVVFLLLLMLLNKKTVSKKTICYYYYHSLCLLMYSFDINCPFKLFCFKRSSVSYDIRKQASLQRQARIF